MATVTVRRLDSNWEPIFGNGKDAYISDIDAVAQIIAMKLKLFLGEWWMNRNEGIPMFQSILGASGSDKSRETIDSLIRSRILEVTYVTGIEGLKSTFDVDRREYKFVSAVNTQFGTVVVTNETNVPYISGSGGR